MKQHSVEMLSSETNTRDLPALCPTGPQHPPGLKAMMDSFILASERMNLNLLKGFKVVSWVLCARFGGEGQRKGI